MSALINAGRFSRLPIYRMFSTGLQSFDQSGSGGRSSVSGLTVTVFGATGFAGRYIVNRLGKIGTQMVIPHRCDVYDIRHLQVMGDLGQIYFRPFHLHDEDKLRNFVKYSNIVINLVGRDHETSNFSFKDVHVGGAVSIAQACKDMGVERLIHFSAYNASYSSPSNFMISKKEGEDMVREIFPDVTVLKPTEMYGFEDRFMMLYASISKFVKIVPLIKKGKYCYKIPIYVSDVGKAVEKCVLDRDTIGKTYYLCGPEKYLYYDMIEYFFRCVQRPFRPFSMPRSLYNLIGLFYEVMPTYRFYTRDLITRMTVSDDFHPHKLGLKDLGITPTNLTDVAIRFLRYYRKFHDSTEPMDDIGTLRKVET